MEDLKEIAHRLYIEEDNSCAESVLKGACELYELPLDENVIKVIGSFSGGCGVGDLCGTAAGGLAAIGLKYGDGFVHKNTLQKEKMKLFMTKYQEMFKSTDCNELKTVYKKEKIKCLELVEKTLQLIGCIFNQ